MNDKKLHVLTIVTMVLVALIAAVVSFAHIYSLAVGYHQPRFLAALYPFATDGLIAVMSFTLYQFARQAGAKAPKLTWAFLGLGVAATVAANFAYGIPFGWPSAVLSCWPAVAFVGCIEVTVETAKKMINQPEPKKVVTPRIETHISTNGGTAVSEAVKQSVKRSKSRKPRVILTNARAAEIAAERGCSTRTVRNHPEWWNIPEVVN